MSPSFANVALSAALFFAAWANAEQHTVSFLNKCGNGTPTLIVNGQIVSTGEDYVSNGPISGAIAYLQTGNCLFNGENCALLETTLGNPTVPGGGPSTDISLIPPHAFNVETSFSYYNGCDGQGADCASATCDTAFFQPNDNQVQVACESDNVNLLIEFCGDATQTIKSSGAPAPVVSATSTTAVHTTSAAAAPPPPPPTTTHVSSTVVHTSSQAPVISSSQAPVISSSHAPVISSSPAVVPTSSAPINVGAPPPSSSLAISTSSSAPSAVVPSSVASAPSASESVSRKLCKSKNTRRAETAPVEPEIRARALYDGRRRHHARMEGRHSHL